MSIEGKSFKFPVWAGWLLFVGQLIFNKWSVEFFLGRYIQDGLAPCTSIVLTFINIYCIIVAIAIIKDRVVVIKGICIYGVLVFVILLSLLLFYRQMGYSFGDLQCYAYGQMYSLLLFLPLILIWPLFGTYFAFVIMMLAGLVQIFYMYYYRSDFGLSACFVIFETNSAELRGFLREHIFNIPIMAYLLSCGLLLWLISWLIKGMPRNHLKIAYLLIAIPVISFLFVSDGRNQLPQYNFFIKIYRSYNAYEQSRLESSKLANMPLDKIEQVRRSQAVPQKELHIFIIGESADRDHFSIYGYTRKTTPLLEGISGELFCFNNVISRYYNTLPVMESLLTFNDEIGKDNGKDKGTFIHYIKKAGYKTYWISNQNPLGMDETLTTILAGSCDKTFFMNASDVYRQTMYDDDIFAPLDDVLAEASVKKFIFINLMGQHEPYRLRYPPAYNSFKGNVPGKTPKQSEIINSYDNATLYNDFIVSTVIAKAKAQGLYSSVVYISDHGNEVYDTRDFSGHTFYGGLETPFIVWLSDQYRQINAQKISIWPGYLGRKGITDCIKYSIFDLLNLDFDSFKPQLSLFNPAFEPLPRIVGPENEQFDYDSQQK